MLGLGYNLSTEPTLTLQRVTLRMSSLFSMSGTYEYLLVDAQHLVHRAAHAYGDLDFVNEQGEVVPTGIIYGFLKLSAQLFSNYADPECRVTICWEGGYKHRTELYPEYKANRRKQPTEEEREELDRMFSQQRALKKILKVAGWAQAQATGYEADDVLATLARRCSEGGGRVGIYTGDQDLHQCVTDRVHVISARPQDEDKIWTPKEVEEKWGVPPERVAEVKAFAGDSGDNIPGCPGCGIGWASKILAGPPCTVQEALDRAGRGEVLQGTFQGKPWKAASLSRKISENQALILTSWELAKVISDVPVELTREPPDLVKLRGVLEKLRMHSLTEGRIWKRLSEVR